MTERKLLFVCVATVVVAVAWAISWGYVNSWRTITEHGYSQMPFQSQVWQAPKR